MSEITEHAPVFMSTRDLYKIDYDDDIEIRFKGLPTPDATFNGPSGYQSITGYGLRLYGITKPGLYSVKIENRLGSKTKSFNVKIKKRIC